MSEFKFELAAAGEVKGERERVQSVEIVTDMTQRCSRCKTVVVAEPMGLSLVDVVDSKERHDAQHAVAVAMYQVTHGVGPLFDDLPWADQCPWLREAAADGWSADSFVLDAIGRGLPAALRAAGVKEAEKWPAYTDRRKVFRVSMAKFPPGWLHLSFEAHGSKSGKPVQHASVQVHICPKCAPAIFDAANVDPIDPFGDGVKW